MLYTSWGVSGTPDEGDDTASCTQRQQTSNDFRGLATPKGGGRELKMTSPTPHPLAPSMEPPLYSVRKWRATTFVDSSSFSRFCPTLEEASAETRPRVSVHADREIRRVIASMNSASIFLHSPPGRSMMTVLQSSPTVMKFFSRIRLLRRTKLAAGAE